MSFTAFRYLGLFPQCGYGDSIFKLFNLSNPTIEYTDFSKNLGVAFFWKARQVVFEGDWTVTLTTGPESSFSYIGSFSETFAEFNVPLFAEEPRDRMCYDSVSKTSGSGGIGTEEDPELIYQIQTTRNSLVAEFLRYAEANVGPTSASISFGISTHSDYNFNGDEDVFVDVQPIVANTNIFGQIQLYGITIGLTAGYGYSAFTNWRPATVNFVT